MTLVNVNRRPVAKGYDDIFGSLFNGFPWTDASRGFSAAPAANIYETPQAYLLELNVPGRAKEDFAISIENEMLTVSFEKKEETKKEDTNAIRREFNFNSFKRSFSLDEKVDTANVQARYENGILKIELPKKEEVKAEAKQIVIH
ncbi:MAG: Hsp20/alpha crystallin family protein [Chitinophagaceae bacterium]|nr:Hsp20/alpha crystallin family protein [Chitinophagaceae bacterium]